MYNEHGLSKLFKKTWVSNVQVNWNKTCMKYRACNEQCSGKLYLFILYCRGNWCHWTCISVSVPISCNVYTFTRMCEARLLYVCNDFFMCFVVRLNALEVRVKRNYDIIIRAFTLLALSQLRWSIYDTSTNHLWHYNTLGKELLVSPTKA